jgi:hypothetical protein
MKYEQMSLNELRRALVERSLQRQAIIQDMRELTRWIDLRAYEGGETPQPPDWAASGDQIVRGETAIGTGANDNE